jgi:hypothetical protein
MLDLSSSFNVNVGLPEGKCPSYPNDIVTSKSQHKPRFFLLHHVLQGVCQDHLRRFTMLNLDISG